MATTLHENGGGAAALRKRIQACWEAARAVEPVRGGVTPAQLERIAAAVATANAARTDGIDGQSGLDRMELEGALATALARAAVAAVAAGDDATALAWLADAERLTSDDDQAEELAAAARSLERYRVLVHGRNRFAAGDEAGARARWQELVDGGGPDDAIGRAAARELSAPRRYTGNTPELFRWNGIGLGFYGNRDRADDGSHVTTHCLSVLFVPLIPVGAYRVVEQDGGYVILSKEPLSRFARVGRAAVVAVAALAAAAYLIVGYLNDPDRLARRRFDAAIAAHGDPEAALRRLDGELGGPDLARVGNDRAERAGAAVVHLTAGFAPEPFTRAHAEQATRLVARFSALPVRARGGVARDALVDELTGWADALAAPADRRAQIMLLRQALAFAEPRRAPALQQRMIDARIAYAADVGADWPLDALAVLVEEPRAPAALIQATDVVARLADHPSLLLDAGADLDAWLAVTSPGDPLRVRVEQQRALAIAARVETTAEGVTAAQLAAMLAARPWDQAAATLLATEELHAGKLAAAEARLRGFGAPGLLTRDARFALAQIAAADGRLDVADQLLSDLLASQLPRFLAASAALQETASAAQARLEERLRVDPPADLRDRYEATTDETEQQRMVGEWLSAELDADPEIAARREAYLAHADVVPVAIASGTIKLRRAQGLSGAERDAMLAEAERAFLAIRTEAEGQPQFHLGLGEIYARLGKIEASDAELGGLLARKDAGLTMAVADVYRNIGSVERATQVATDAYAAFASPERERFASLLGVMNASDDDESEAWFRKADQSIPYVRTSLLAIEANRQRRQGKWDECARTYAAVARAYADSASAGDSTALNNTAVAHQSRYQCNGDPAALVDAQTALDQAYRLAGEQPIVLGNLIDLLVHRGRLRVLDRRIDLRALPLSSREAEAMLDLLLDGSEREAILAELTADPGLRRSRDLVRQHEVLAPNSLDPYVRQFEWASATRDEIAAAAVLARMRQARALDTSDARRALERHVTGDDLEQTLGFGEVALARLDEVLARPRLDPRTRATALRLSARARSHRGLHRGVPADLAAARADLRKSDELWPAQADPMDAAAALVDEIAVQLDAKRWPTMRRSRDAFAALARLADDRDPLAASISAAPAWAEVLALVRRDHGRPGLGRLRIARLLGDAEVTARARPALDDKLVRMRLELEALTAPGDPSTAEGLAVLDAR